MRILQSACWRFAEVLGNPTGAIELNKCRVGTRLRVVGLKASLQGRNAGFTLAITIPGLNATVRSSYNRQQYAKNNNDNNKLNKRKAALLILELYESLLPRGHHIPRLYLKIRALHLCV